MSVISSVLWVPRGKFAQFPVVEGKTEQHEVPKELQVPEEDQDNPTTSSTTAAGPIDEEMADIDQEVAKEYDLENYDKEEADALDTGMAPFYKNQEEDPYLENPQEEEDEEIQEYTVMPSDLFVLSATTDTNDDFSHLDVHIYEEEDENAYCHHDILLPSFPLCMAWMEFNPATGLPGNCVAVGTFKPEIEIWNLDVVDSPDPVAVLGGEVPTQAAAEVPRKKLKKQPLLKKPSYLPGSHTDAVMALAWNYSQNGSADRTVKVWDVEQRIPLHTFTHHKDKVQCVSWHPTEPAIILTAGFDRQVCVLDVRTDKVAFEWSLPSADPEAAEWNVHKPNEFFISQENGMVLCYDALGTAVAPGKKAGKPLWNLSAHSKATTALCVSPGVPGFIATGSMDKTVKLWSIKDNQPKALHTKRMPGQVYSLSFSADSPFSLAIGGDTKLEIYNTATIAAVKTAFIVPDQAIVPSSEEGGEGTSVTISTSGGAEHAAKKELKKKKKKGSKK